jgi:hypothetical protein
LPLLALASTQARVSTGTLYWTAICDEDGGERQQGHQLLWVYLSRKWGIWAHVVLGRASLAAHEVCAVAPEAIERPSPQIPHGPLQLSLGHPRTCSMSEPPRRKAPTPDWYYWDHTLTLSLSSKPVKQMLALRKVEGPRLSRRESTIALRRPPPLSHERRAQFTRYHDKAYTETTRQANGPSPPLVSQTLVPATAGGP